MQRPNRINPTQVLRQIRISPKQTGSKKPYQVIKEDIFEMIGRRKLNMGDFGMCIYLRGKARRYGNPFKLSNTTMMKELHQSEYQLRKLRQRLQVKGLIKYDTGTGKGWTTYTMLDSVMAQR